MLRKMLFQGLIAAAVIAGGAALYAVTTTAEPLQVAQADAAPAGKGGNGYLQMDRDRAGKDMHDRHKRDDAREHRKHRDDERAQRKHRDDEHGNRKHKRDHDDD